MLDAGGSWSTGVRSPVERGGPRTRMLWRPRVTGLDPSPEWFDGADPPGLWRLRRPSRPEAFARVERGLVRDDASEFQQVGSVPGDH